MKSKIILLLFVCASIVTGCSNENKSLDKDTIKNDAVQKIEKLVLNQKFSEAEAVLDFAEKQIKSKIHNIRGTIDSLKLAEECYLEEDYTQALIHVNKAYDVAKGDEMIKGVIKLKEEITKAQNVADKDLLTKNNKPELITWNEVTASSYLPHQTKNYQPQSAVDEYSNTAWIENGIDEDGIGEYIELKNINTIRVDKICMTNGFAYDEKTYKRNNRIENARIVFYDKNGQEVSTMNHTFEDDNLNIIEIDVPGEIEASSIRIYIESVYTKDRLDKDTCISYLAVYGDVLN